MNLMDCMMDEFDDEASIKSMNDRDICSWLEVKGRMSVCKTAPLPFWFSLPCFNSNLNVVVKCLKCFYIDSCVHRNNVVVLRYADGLIEGCYYLYHF